MSVPEAFAWSPAVALASGALAGLLALRSWRAASAGALVVMLLQVAAWAALFAAAAPGEGWQVALGAGFLRGLLVALPYTALGAAAGAGLAAVARRLARP